MTNTLLVSEQNQWQFPHYNQLCSHYILMVQRQQWQPIPLLAAASLRTHGMILKLQPHYRMVEQQGELAELHVNIKFNSIERGSRLSQIFYTYCTLRCYLPHRYPHCGIRTL